MNPTYIERIFFKPLQSSDFPLLLKWLQSPHVKKWYDPNTSYTLETVTAKYSDYVKEYKSTEHHKKPIFCYLCYIDEQPIGYIQLYSVHDFDEKKEFHERLPQKTGRIDFYIGDLNFIGMHLGSTILQVFLKKIAFVKYPYVFVDPKIANESAVKCFEHAGFEVIQKYHHAFWMIASNQKIRLSIKDLIILEVAFERYFLKNDKLFIFGSRTDLQALGGDLDIYIETHAESVNEAVTMKNNFTLDLLKYIGDFKIDIVLNILNLKNPLPIYTIAKEQGVLLNEKHS